jgi:hypothetical protein
MSAAFDHDDFAGEPRKQITVCSRCGKPKQTKLIDGEERCAACDAAINAGEVPTHWEP